MILCPVCESGEITTFGTCNICRNCHNKWSAPKSLTYTFPYPFGTILYSPNKFRGKVHGADEYKVVGYEVNERGKYIQLLPVSHDGISTNWRLDSDNLFETKEEAMQA